MKKKDLVSLRKKEVKELEKMVEEKKAKALNTHVKMQAGQEKNLKKVKNMKKEIAQILTIIKEKKLSEEEMPEKKEKEETK